ncbi:hypothetical protein BTA35_0211565 [Oceanospirillum linum]|uniref:High-affinity zinc uptake system protein ZnuA n=2 Tax=Oceanospirillum linum TaxID=966 RepID=A0A1T1HAS5_OCELI|nr:hypothetical protein BTA35_0211565 [Oceanospirillum linum]
MLLFTPVSSAADKPLVFVSVSPQKYLLQQIAGDQVNIEVLVQPGHNPHSYDPSARQMARLAKAQMLMTTGVPFEQVWLPRISRLNSEMRLVDTLAGSAPVKAAYISRHDHHEDQVHDHDAHSSHDEHSHDHENMDPHIWMDPMKALSQARIMTDALKELRPETAEIFEQGYLSLANELKALDREVHELLEPYEDRTFMVFHPAWGHFAARYHLKQIAIEYQGKSPSARQLVGLSETAKAENIKVILVQEQFNQKPAERIAENIGARVVKADPLPENLPKAIRMLSEQLLESWH